MPGAPKKKAAAKKDKPALGAGQDDLALKQAVLKSALKDAAFDGFTPAVLEKAGKAAGLNKTAMERLFPDGPVSLIAFYSEDADRQMQARLDRLDLAAMKVRARIRQAVRARLDVLKPNKEAARRAAAVLSLPNHAGLTAKLLYRSVDAMWRAVGDTSTDFNFYTKRAILAGVYGATLMRWFNDAGDDESATDAFLDARIENVMQFEKFKAEAKKALGGFPVFKNWAKKT